MIHRNSEYLIMEITIKPLSSDPIADYLSFFYEKHFTDNPDWSKCYCYFCHIPQAPHLLSFTFCLFPFALNKSFLNKNIFRIFAQNQKLK